jgi:nucleotide-binding universal stress UspA family protein
LASSKEARTVNRILVGTDGSSSADLAVGSAAELAASRDAELLVVHVRRGESIRDAADPRKVPDVERYLRGMSERFPNVRVRSWSETGDPAGRLVEVAEREHVETIVVGNRGASGSRWRVRRSVPTAVVRRSTCSVFVVDTRVAQ